MSESTLMESPVPASRQHKIAQEAPTFTSKADWFRESQEAAWSLFQQTPNPTRKDESWRFGNLSHLDLERYVSGVPVSKAAAKDLVSRSDFMEGSAGHAVFANGQLIAFQGISDELSNKGVIFEPMSVAVEKHGDLVQKHFMAQNVELGSAKYAALHHANAGAGMFVFVPDNVVIEEPLEVFHWAAGADVAVFPHALIVTGKNASVHYLDRFQSASDESGFSCGVTDLVADDGSRLEYAGIQEWSPNMRSIHINSCVSGRDANVLNGTIQLGAQWSRTESVSHLLGKGGNSDMLSVTVPFGNQEVDQRTLQHHAEMHTTSDLLFKNVLYDNAKTIFAGLIQVDDGAHQTDAYQTCRNLLMSDSCEAHSMPGLEINADQVKCSHGSTSGRIEESEIFYFCARGIPANTARQLISLGFTHEVINKLKHDALIKKVCEKVEDKFARILNSY